ncbi:transposase [Bradyrhizobium sp. UASWS1016]|uniref:IS66 family insertion sequence element accessory protein TnpA n=1 Tax=Bradyrhizobium sp. UASWS1016 TaxID=1566379 RepID=UPI0008571A68|nr:transposase [Bradyrhizobium sp. UASWS1016]MBK5652216.1 transposase [Rhizobium sp.]OCX33153.1 transposase [Bradyrhizobium sp. UASWS1016]
MGPKHFQNKARREWWSLHIEAWRRSGLGIRKYCRQQRLTENTFRRWLKQLVGEETARKLAEYQTELRREQRREERENVLRRRRRRRFSVTTDVRNRAMQAFWAMHVEAMNWSGMGVREYAAALSLSPYALRKWRDRLAAGEVEIDWRAHLHPSARPAVSTSARNSAPQRRLTATKIGDRAAPAAPLRRFFSDEEKLAIARETEQPGAKVSAVARKHGIVTGLLFRWRVQFGIGQTNRSKLARVALADTAAETRVLRNLVRSPEGMVAVELADGGRVFAPVGSDPDAVRAQIDSGEITR